MSDTLYDRVGGEEGISRIVDAFYDELQADPELQPFFIHSSPETLRRMQRQFLSAALGGSIPYRGRSMQDAHAGRGITRRHIQLFIDHMISALSGVEIDEEDIKTITARINMYADEVTGDKAHENP